MNGNNPSSVIQAGRKLLRRGESTASKSMAMILVLLIIGLVAMPAVLLYGPTEGIAADRCMAGASASAALVAIFDQLPGINTKRRIIFPNLP